MKVFISLFLLLSTSLFALNTEVRFDMLKVQLKNQLEAQEYKKAIKTFSKIRKYKKQKLPVSYDFYEGQVNFEAHHYKKAYRLLDKYVSNVGRDGEYYDMSLPMLLSIEDKIKAKKIKKQAILKLKRKSIFLDLDTNLMWQNSKTLFIGTYKKADNYCSNLKLNGFNNWYLPNASQLKSINNKNKKQHILEGFKHLKNNKFWASNGNYDNNKNVWYLDFKHSNLVKINTNSKKHLSVRCVREKL